MKRSTTWMAWVFGLCVLGFSLYALAGPLELMQSKEGQVKTLLAKPTVKGTPEHDRKESDLRAVINELFDFEELGKRALELHWDDLSDAQRVDFVSTLKALIEKNYLLRITKATTYTIQWFGAVPGEDYTTVRFKIASGKYKAAIQFRVIEKGGKWVIFDMLIDDVSLMENYRSQFNRIIRNESFDALMGKMRKKLTDLDANPGSGKVQDDKLN